MRAFVTGKRLAVVVVGGACLAAALGVALAYFSSTGSGTASASVGALDASMITSATTGAGTVALTWSAVTPPASGTVTYYVTRDGGNAAGTCPTSASPASVTSCTDSGLSAGSHDYTVTAIFHSWVAMGATATVDLASGAATQIVLTGSTADLASGATRTLTATVEDAAGNTVVTGSDSTASVSFAQTGGTGSVTGAGSTPASGGVATKIVTGNLAGPVTLQASATLLAGATSSNTLGFTVTFGAATQIVLTGATGDLASGATRTLTATIKDANGNTVASGPDSGLSVDFSQAAGTGTVSGTGTVTASGGVATKVVTGGAAGPVTLQAAATLSVAGFTVSNALSFNVVAGAATQVALTGSTADLTSGSTRDFTATIQDAAGNTVTAGANSSVSVSFAQTAGAGSLTGTGSATASGGVATKTLTGNAAGSVTIRASATLSGPGSTSSNTLIFNVVPGSASKLVFTTSPQMITAGGAVTGTMTVQRQDANSNLTTQGAITVGLAGTAGTGTFRNSADTATVTSVSIANGASTADFKYKDTVAGTPTITASSSPLTSATQTVTVNAAGTKTAVATGAWNSAATWSPSGVPTAGDNVLIQGAFTVTIPSGYAAVANSVTYGNSANTTVQTLAFTDATSSLAVGGDFVVSAPSAGATRNVPVNAGTLSIGGNLRLSAGASGNQNNRINQVTITTGTVSVSGNLVYNDGNFLSVNALQSQLVMSGGAGTFNLAGSFTINSGGGTQTGTLTAGTASTFNYSGGAAQTIPVGVSGINYNNLTVSNTSAGGATLSAAATTTNLTGDVTIAAGATLNAGNLTHSLAGSFTNNGTFNAGAGTIAFAGSTAQAIGGSSATAFNNLTVGNTAATVTLGTSASVAGDLTVSNGTFDLGANTIDRATSGGTLAVYGGTLKIGGTNGLPANYATHTFAAAGTVNYSGTNQAVSTESYSGLTLSGSGTKTVAGDMAVAGDFTNNGTTFAGSNTVTFNGTTAQSIGGTSSTTFNDLTINKSAGVATLGVNQSVAGDLSVSAGTLNLSTFTVDRATAGGTLTVGANATLSIGGTNGFPANYATRALNATSTVNYSGAGAQTIAALNYGNLTSSSTGARTFPSGGTIRIAGAFTQGTNTYTVTGSTVDFNGTSAQTVPLALTPSYANLTLDNASASGATLGAAITATKVTGNLRVQTGTLNDGAFAIAGNAAATLEVAAGATFSLTVNGAFPTGFGTTTLAATSTVNYARGGAQTVANAPTYGNLVVSGGNTKTAGGALTVAGDFTIASATTFAASTFSHSVAGDWANSGTFTANTSTVTFNGSAAQTISGPNATSFSGLTISNGSGVALGGVDAAATGTLALGTSVVTTGANKVIVTTVAPTRTTGYVAGALQRTGSVSTMVFPVGNGSNDTTVNIGVATCTGCTLTVRSTGGEHPNVATSGLSSTKDVNTYWTLASTGTITFGTTTFTYPSGNVDVGATPAGFQVKRWNGTTWSAVTVSGTPTTTSTSLTGLTSVNLGDFIIGNP